MKIVAEYLLIFIGNNDCSVGFTGYGISQVTSFKYRKPGTETVSRFPQELIQDFNGIAAVFMNIGPE